MSKPNWEDAPFWAEYLSQDENGAWYWFENEPLRNRSGEWVCMEGDCMPAASGTEWAETLEKTP